MRKTLLISALLLAATSLCAQTTAQKAAGNYSGRLYVNLFATIDDTTEPLCQLDEDGYAVLDDDNNPIPLTFNVVIEAQTDNTVKFGLYNFGFLGLELGDIVLNNVPVEAQGDGSVKFGENAPVNFSFLEGQIEATAKINEENSYVKGDYAYIDVDVVWTNSDTSLDASDKSDDVPIFVRFMGTDAVKTGIADISTNVSRQDGKAFDLQGRRAAAGKGIRIYNGKKIIK